MEKCTIRLRVQSTGTVSGQMLERVFLACLSFNAEFVVKLM